MPSPRACVPSCRRIGRRFGANVKVVEVPPGPPVLSPIVAEIYGPEADGRRQVAKAVRARVRADARASSTSTTAASRAAPRTCCWSTAARRRCSACRSSAIVSTLRAGLAGEAAAYLHDGSKYPAPGGVAAAGRAQRRSRRAAAAGGARRGRPAGADPRTGTVSDTVREQPLSQGPAAGELRRRRHGRRASTARCTACSAMRGAVRDIATPDGGQLGENFIRQPADP